MSSWSGLNPLRVAVVGVGYLGNFHAQKIQALESQLPVKLVCISDSTATLLNERTQALKVPGYQNYKELLGLVDAVTIATTTSSHFEVAKFFLQNKIHVNVEKPICVTAQEAQELISLSQKSGVTLAVGHSERFSSVQRALKELVKKPLHIELERLAPFKGRGGDVSVMLDLLVHDIDLARDLVEQDFTWKSARMGRVFSSTGDWISAQAQTNSISLQFHVSRTAAEMSRKITVYEEDRVLCADFQNLKITVSQRVKKDEPLHTETHSVERSDNLAIENKVFLENILFKRPLLVDGAAGFFALKMALAAAELTS